MIYRCAATRNLLYCGGTSHMKFFRPMRLLFLAVLTALVALGLCLWNYVSELTGPILTPTNSAYSGYSTIPSKVLGLKLEQFTFTGWDGGEVVAVIAKKDGEESSRQLTVIGDLNTNKADRLHEVDYALVCVDWDHGILSALPLAESLTAAGITCVLWEPRGSGNRRSYCTHGLRESADVPLLINELTHRSGKAAPVIVGVGQGYGAGLMLQAAAMEPRLQGLISIDAYASLRESVTRTMSDNLLSHLSLWLMDLRISSSVGFECFDVAPVESASRIDRNVPVLIINLARANPVCTLDDAVNIYRQLPCDEREIWTMQTAEDAPDATSRTITISRRKVGRNHQYNTITTRLLKDEDNAITGMVHWLNDTFITALDTPHISQPARPLLSSDCQL